MQMTPLSLATRPRARVAVTRPRLVPHCSFVLGGCVSYKVDETRRSPTIQPNESSCC